ncbi:lipopolysaccharide assembly protein LapA domain-containing protein [Agarilytica rhodophyticola]|uniref:lipopolysaccharide assembly protein LapA domain-containing protein n=1 Tax=Agarilytica rhodophyticola TaxID=1737490 RepID=UPI000B347283|nr:lipopolysaccharide assembly protein LapA domain-containing protein [Agarilytica rhodophyticola]
MLKWSKRIVLSLWLCLMLVVGFWIFAENPGKVNASFIIFAFKDLALGHLMCGMLLLGALLGWLTSTIMFGSKSYGHKRRYKKASKEVEKLKSLQEQT